jgi:hypothetical protein
LDGSQAGDHAVASTEKTGHMFVGRGGVDTVRRNGGRRGGRGREGERGERIQKWWFLVV